ncbi:MAG: SpoIIE family protein phosphatase [Balneolaceae bacterium]
MKFISSSIDNLQNVTQSKKKNRSTSRFELRTLLETSRMLIESRKTGFVLNNLLFIVMGKLSVPQGCILMYNPDRKEHTVSRIKGETNVKEGDAVELTWDLSELAGNVIDPDQAGGEAPHLFSDSSSGLYFVLRTRQHHLGYLYLGKKEEGLPLDQDEIEFVESLCIISSVAIDNSQMFSKMQEINRKLDQRVYELNTLFDLSRDFNMMVDRKKIANTFKFALLGQLLIRRFLFLFEIEGEPVLLESSGLDSLPDEEIRSGIFDFALGVMSLEEKHYESCPWLKENEITALITLELEGEKAAVVGIGERANREPYTRDDFNFLQSLGNLALLSIQRTLFLEQRISNERFEEELNIAKTIQQGLYPDPVPPIPTLDLAAINVPSYQVGGDYFDILQTPDTNYIMAIADVTGKGMPAALLMANLQSMLHILLPVDITLADATGRINNLIYDNTPDDKFITFCWAKYFPETRNLRYINAGHNPPVVLRNGSNELETLQKGGLILGVMESITPYEETTIQLETGDIVLFYTDGVTETFNAGDEEFGEERLGRILIENRDQPSRQLIRTIIDRILEFSNGKLSDDMTMILFKVE